MINNTPLPKLISHIDIKLYISHISCITDRVMTLSIYINTFSKNIKKDKPGTVLQHLHKKINSPTLLPFCSQHKVSSNLGNIYMCKCKRTSIDLHVLNPLKVKYIFSVRGFLIIVYFIILI